MPPHDSLTAEANGSLIKMEGGIFAAIGFAIIGSAIGALVRNRQPQTLLCSLWLLGIFIFATFLNWSFTSKTLLPRGSSSHDFVKSMEKKGFSLAENNFYRVGVPPPHPVGL